MPDTLNKMKDYIGTEAVIHGQKWGALHDGYFSDPAIARLLIDTAKDILAKSPADMVVDLGGGTGFLLSQLAACQGVDPETTLVNVDCSEIQLALSDTKGISQVCSSVMDFRRRDIAANDKRLFFMMRSVLHYMGKNDLSALLCHLRRQAEEHEFFVHQSASFESVDEAACLNALYRHMRTRKWYPTVNDLKKYLADSGWRVTATVQAPSLLLTSDDLGRRYALDTNSLKHIRKMMTKTYDSMNSVFRLTPAGFEATLEYRIYTCMAVPHSHSPAMNKPKNRKPDIAGHIIC